MNLTLYITDSEPERLTKTLKSPIDTVGNLRDASSIISPVIRVEGTADVLAHNYVYIPEFGRYYYISDCVSYVNGLWDLRLKCDVLMSFRDDILNSGVILADTEETGMSLYLNGAAWVNTCKDKTEIINFSGGFEETGEYILITAGGIAS